MKARVNNEKDRNTTHLTRLEKDEITWRRSFVLEIRTGNFSKSVTLWTSIHKGVDHFGDCFVRVRPINRLFSCKYRTFGQMSGLSTYFPFPLAFYFAIIVTTRRKLQALVYDIRPSTTAVFSYATGPRKLSANEQFFVLFCFGCYSNSSTFVTNNSSYIRRLFYN